MGVLRSLLRHMRVRSKHTPHATETSKSVPISFAEPYPLTPVLLCSDVVRAANESTIRTQFDASLAPPHSVAHTFPRVRLRLHTRDGCTPRMPSLRDDAFSRLSCCLSSRPPDARQTANQIKHVDFKYVASGVADA